MAVKVQGWLQDREVTVCQGKIKGQGQMQSDFSALKIVNG